MAIRPDPLSVDVLKSGRKTHLLGHTGPIGFDVGRNEHLRVGGFCTASKKQSVLVANDNAIALAA